MSIEKVSNTVNSDLSNERAKCSFDVQELAVWWNGGPEKYAEMKKLESVFYIDAFKDETPHSYLSFMNLHTNAMRKNEMFIRKLHQFIRENTNLTNLRDKVRMTVDVADMLSGTELFHDGHPFMVHFGMFSLGIMNLASDEQLDEWLENVYNFRMIGTYAQTEIGHGTFVRGLQTTATYDVKSEEFVLNTPCLEAYKWWPGGLGQNCNYAIVIAQLYSNGKHYGIQQFMVQVRNSETWEPMPGIHIGECGPKMGNQNFNNGFLCLTNVRIPRKNMLMKYAKVLKDGTFVQLVPSVLVYTTLVQFRALIISTANKFLSQATTIATRYSAVRRQSPIDPDKPEPQIMDHITQQHKLFPNIAKCFAFKILADEMTELFERLIKSADTDDFSRLAEVHALLCGFKSYVSSASSTGIEQLRMSCGGHGYMESSNLPKLYTACTAACTYEGENTILYLQTARFLIKAYARMLERKPLEPTISYLQRFTGNETFRWSSDLKSIVDAFQLAASNKIKIAYESVEQRKSSGYSIEFAASQSGILLVQAAEAHSVAVLSEIALNMSRNVESFSQSLGMVFKQLMELFLLDLCLTRTGDLLRFTNINENIISNFESRFEEILSLLRPNAVGLVDGFDYHDFSLRSTLGSYDGNVYERLYTEALKSPLNRFGVRDSFEKYIKPLMTAKL